MLRRANAEWPEDVHPRFREELSRRVWEFPHRSTYPAYSDLIAGADGNVWVQHSHVPGDGERRWTVFDATGRPVRLVRSSLPIVITDAGADYVVAWMRDALGVERVLVFDLPELQH